MNTAIGSHLHSQTSTRFASTRCLVLLGLSCVLVQCGKPPLQAAHPDSATSFERVTVTANVTTDETEWMKSVLDASVQAKLAERVARLQDVPKDSKHHRFAASLLGYRFDASGEKIRLDFAEESPASSNRRDKRINAYELRRSQTEETAESQWDLSKWCRSQGLSGRARAHALQVVSLEANHLAARRFLGHIRVGDQWIAASDLQSQQDRLRSIERASKKYEMKIRRIAAGFESEHPRHVSKAKNDLQALDSPDAIFVVTRVALDSEDSFSLAAVNWLSDRRETDSSEALARLAVYDSRRGLRALARKALASRDPHEYMPVALSWCEGEVDITHEWITSESGQIVGVDRLITRHGSERVEETRWRTNVERTGPANRLSGSAAAADAEQLIRLDAVKDLETLTETTKQQNEQAALFNRRVLALVQDVDEGAEVDASAEELKRWWYGFNGFASSQKQPVYRKLVEDRYERSVGNRQLLSSGSMREIRLPQAQAGECLVKGTLVWTDRGARQIETLKPGDQVLSCDVESAELSYQSVLERTVRPPTPLVTIQLAEETITASPGHPFWVAGRGWVMARDLKPSDPIHAADSIVVVKSLGSAAAEPTYNLRVENNRNYFVGKSRVLSHDVQLRRVSTGPLPGIGRQDLAMLVK